MENELIKHPYSRPDYMTVVHEELLKAFWKEGLTPTPMVRELAECAGLPQEQAQEIVSYWLWCDWFNV